MAMPDSAPIRVLQITDTHLYADPGERLKGIRTTASLQAIVDRLVAEAPAFDFVAATGDLVHDGSDAGYERLREQLGRLQRPVFCLAGNHDEGGQLRRHLNAPPFHVDRSLRKGNWLLVFLDSSLPGSEAGHLAESELEALTRILGRHDAAHVLVCVHHHPLPVRSAWMDTMVIDNGDALVRLCKQHGRVRGILFGHIHQDYERDLDGLRLIASPSTCVQFLPGSDDFALDPRPPGWRWLELHPDGRIVTRVERLDHMTDALDIDAEYG